MHTSSSRPSETTSLGDGAIFGHVLVGIDDTQESLVAAAQAGALLAPEGRLVLVAVAERHLAAHAGLRAANAGSHVAMETSAELDRARQVVDADEVMLVSGRLTTVLRHECQRRAATMIAVGARPHRRLPALALGGHEVEMLREGACSVLVARPGWGPHRPDRVVAAVDGSAESRAAEAAARSLASRLACDFVPVVGLEDVVDLAVLRAERMDGLLDPGRLPEAVCRAATRSSLVVVGRATPHDGRRNDGVVEQIVFGVDCSVLVVGDRGRVAAA